MKLEDVPAIVRGITPVLRERLADQAKAYDRKLAVLEARIRDLEEQATKP